MLYKPTTHGIFSRLVLAIMSAFAALRRQREDTQYLEGMRASELEDLGLRRTDIRDYRTFW